MVSINRNDIRDVLKIALPAVGEMILYMMIWVLDTMMVGKYGGNVLVTAVGLCSEILYTFFNILIAVGISVGVTSLIARKIGAKEFEQAEEFATISLITTIIIGIMFTFVFFTFSKPILIFAKADKNVLELGSSYMKICSIGLFFSMIANNFNGVLRGFGNTKTPLLVSVIVNIVNITLDYALIFGKFGLPELGSNGAAIATSIANIVGFMCVTYFILKKSKIKPRVKYIKSFFTGKLKELLLLSIPSGLQEGAFSICRLINAFMIMQIGNISFAANQITTTIESLSFMPGWGFAIAATTLVGQKVGEKDYKKAKEYGDTCILLGSVIMGVCSVLFLVCPNFLIGLFINESETSVIQLGALCIMISSIEQIPMAISMIVGGSLKGAGDTKSPFIISVISNWAIRLPLMYFFILHLKSSVTYVWWITAVQWFFDAVLIYMIYRKKFKKNRKAALARSI